MDAHFYLQKLLELALPAVHLHTLTENIIINDKDSHQQGVNKHYKSKPIPGFVLILYRYVLPCVLVVIAMCYCKYGLGLKKKIKKKKIDK